MRGKIIEFTKDVIPAGALLIFASGLFYAGGEFYSLRNMIQEGWTYGMERETWLEVRADNPGFKVPDTEKIRKNHQTGIFTDRSKVVSQN